MVNMLMILIQDHLLEKEMKLRDVKQMIGKEWRGDLITRLSDSRI